MKTEPRIEDWVGRTLEAGEGFGEEVGASDAARSDPFLPSRGPPPCCDVLAGEMNHAVDSLKAGGVEAALGGIPPDRGFARLRFSPDQPDGLMVRRSKRRNQRGPHEATGSRDQYLHGATSLPDQITRSGPRE